MDEASRGASLFDDTYFHSWNYAGRSMGRLSMYRVARGYYASLVRRYAPPGDRSRTLLEIGCGLGDLLRLLQDDFTCTGIDLIASAVEQARRQAPAAEVIVADASDLSSFADGALSVVVSLHVVEHLDDPRQMLIEVGRMLRRGGLLVFATPHPEYPMRRFKDRDTDAIGMDPTHINCHVPSVWRGWCEGAGLDVVRHFADGLWDVPYLPLLPRVVQFALFGLPAAVQVATRTTFMPLGLGVNQVVVARKAS